MVRLSRSKVEEHMAAVIAREAGCATNVLPSFSPHLGSHGLSLQPACLRPRPCLTCVQCVLRRLFPLHVPRRLFEASPIMGCVQDFMNVMQ
jgi:hypothetical protein